MREGVEMPISTGIYRVIHEGADPAEVLVEIMTRDLKPEVDVQVLEAARNLPSGVSDRTNSATPEPAVTRELAPA